jgi:two-component system NarL family response regulator
MREKGCFISKRVKETWTEMSLKILILSDNADVRRQLKRLVDPHPAWKVDGAMACDKALAESQRKRSPDVIILEMSRLDATMIPLISSLRDKFGSSKILAVSSQRDSRLVLRMIHAGANGYLIMDRASEELAAAIKTIAAGGTYLSPGIAGLTGRRPS